MTQLPRQPKSSTRRPAGSRPTVGLAVENAPRFEARPGPSPLYQQVKDYILAHIADGSLPPESRVPSETELVDRLGLSKMTVNRALRELTAAGVLVRIQGVGTFVASPKPVSTLLDIKPIAEEIAQRGGVHSCRVHLQARETAPPDLALAMALPAGAEVFHSMLVHSDDGQPIQLEDRYVNPALAPNYLDQDFTRITPSRYLLDVVPLTEVEHVIEAVAATEQISDLLQIGRDEPCLALYRRTWSGDLVATRSRFIHPGSKYRLGGRFRPTSPSQALEA